MLPEHGDGEAERGTYHFDGLDGLSGTTFPDVLLDQVMANLTGAEFKVLAYIVRRTIGFGRASDTISLDQICSGVRGRNDAVVDAGTGLSKKTAIAALKGLQDKGVVVARKATGKDRVNLPTALSLRFRDQPVRDQPGGDEPGGLQL